MLIVDCCCDNVTLSSNIFSSNEFKLNPGNLILNDSVEWMFLRSFSVPRGIELMSPWRSRTSVQDLSTNGAESKMLPHTNYNSKMVCNCLLSTARLFQQEQQQFYWQDNRAQKQGDGAFHKHSLLEQKTRPVVLSHWGNFEVNQIITDGTLLHSSSETWYLWSV